LIVIVFNCIADLFSPVERVMNLSERALKTQIAGYINRRAS
jgi:hypothetical protein